MSTKKRRRDLPERNGVESMRELEDFDPSFVDAATKELVEQWLAGPSGVEPDKQDEVFEEILAPIQGLEEWIHTSLTIDRIGWDDSGDRYSMHATYNIPPVNTERISGLKDEDLQRISRAIPAIEGITRIPASWVEGFDATLRFDGLLRIWIDDGYTMYDLTDDELVLLNDILSGGKDV